MVEKAIDFELDGQWFYARVMFNVEQLEVATVGSGLPLFMPEVIDLEITEVLDQEGNEVEVTPVIEEIVGELVDQL